MISLESHTLFASDVIMGDVSLHESINVCCPLVILKHINILNRQIVCILLYLITYDVLVISMHIILI